MIASSTRGFITPRDGTPPVINPCPTTQDQGERAQYVFISIEHDMERRAGRRRAGQRISAPGKRGPGSFASDQMLPGEAGIPLVRSPRTLPRILEPAEVDALTAALRTHRDRAMVAAMVLGGLCRCEVLGLRLEDLRFGERRLFIAEGKGGYQRLVPVSPRFFTEVSAYLDAERPAGTSTGRCSWS